MPGRKNDVIEIEDEIDDDDMDYEDDIEEEERRGRRKKIFVLFIVLILIFAVFTVLFYFNPGVKGVQIQNPRPKDDGTGIIVEAFVQMEGGGYANGDGKIKILYEGEEKYSSTISFNTDRGLKEIEYTDFFWDNGDYEIVVIYKDKEDVFTFDPGDDTFSFGIAEYVNVTIKEPANKKADLIKLDIIATIKDVDLINGNEVVKPARNPAKNSTITIEIRHEDGTEESYSKLFSNSFNEVYSDFVYYSDNSGPGNGDYTVSAKITNHFVKPGSPKFNIDLGDIRTQFLNILPYADAGGDQSEKPGTADSIEINFDASESWNDGEILSYKWDFDFDGENFTVDYESDEPSASWVYQRSGKLRSQDKYTVRLVVEGDVIIEGLPGIDDYYEFANDEIEVTIDWAFKL